MRRINYRNGVRVTLAVGLGLFVLSSRCWADDAHNAAQSTPPAQAAGAAEQATSFAGTFANDKLTLDLHATADGYAGTLSMGGHQFGASGTVSDGELAGTFNANGQAFKFLATRSGDLVTLSSGQSTFALKPIGSVPVPVAPANPLQGAGPAPAPAQTPAAPAGPAAAPADVMRFQPYSVQDDPNWIGGEAITLLIPEGWKVTGGMEWRPETVLRVQPHLQIADPNSPAAVTLYPTQTFTYGVNVRGTSYLGDEIEPLVQNYMEALSKYVIPRYRTDLTNAKVVDTQDLPDWANTPSIWVQSIPGAPMHGSAGRVRVEYEINGQAVQEDFFVRVQERYKPRMQTTGWIIEVSSVRGAKGSLDTMRPILRTVALSKTISLPWYNKLQQYVIMTNKMTIDKIKAEGVRAQIRTNLSNEISDANKQQYQAQQSAQDASNQATAETMRDQQPYTTTSGGKVEIPIQAATVWQGANGEIVTSANGSYNPNNDPNKTSTYTQLQKAPGLNGQRPE